MASLKQITQKLKEAVVLLESAEEQELYAHARILKAKLLVNSAAKDLKSY